MLSFKYIIITALVAFVGLGSTSKLSAEMAAKRIGYTATAILPANGGPYSTDSSIIAALSKVVGGRRDEAMNDLYAAVATITNYIINDRFLYMIGKDAIDSISRSKKFSRTREAFANYNRALFTHLFELQDDTDRKEVLAQIERAMYFVKRAFADEVYKLSDRSKTIKKMKKLKDWGGTNDITGIISFAFDVISLRVNLRLLREAIDNHESINVAAHCLGISAGIIGIDDFVAAVKSEIRVLSYTGMMVGSLMNVAVTFLNIHNQKHFTESETDIQINFESKTAIETLGEHSKKQLRMLMLLISNQRLFLNDLYVVNQGVLPKWGILYGEDRGALQFGAFSNGSEGDSPIYRKEDSSDIFLVAGKARRVRKAEQPSTDVETDIVGFDFYGTFSRGYPYKGSTVIVSTENISTQKYRLNSLKINTCLQKQWYHPSDHLLLTDMMNMDQGENIDVNMGKGDDVIIINGMLGRFENSSEGLLKADLGSGLNSLSFEGMDHNRKDIKGIFFDSKDGKLSYFHGPDAKLHNIGTVQPVHILFGSPFNDYIILFGVDNGNPNGHDFTVIQRSGKNFYEIDLGQVIASAPKRRFKIIDNSKKSPTIVIRTSGNVTRNELVFVGNVFKVYKQRNKNSPIEAIVSVHVISKDVPMIKVVDAYDNSVMDDIKSNSLGPEFVKGLSIENKVSTSVNGSELNDVCVLQCSEKRSSPELVVVDLGQGEDVVVLKDSTFMEPCGINSEDFKVWLEPKLNNGTDGEGNEEWFLKVERKSNVFRTYLLRNVEKIVNAFGSLIVNLANEKRTTTNLLTTYISVTSHEIGLFK